MATPEPKEEKEAVAKTVEEVKETVAPAAEEVAVGQTAEPSIAELLPRIMELGSKDKVIGEKVTKFAIEKGYKNFKDFKQEDVPALLEVMGGASDVK